MKNAGEGAGLGEGPGGGEGSEDWEAELLKVVALGTYPYSVPL